jgi:hypothetical protein
MRKGSARRRRKDERKLLPLIVSPEDGLEEFPALDFKTFPYRTALANWPDEWRERWGHRANSLEEEGLAWREAESRAFFEVQEERRTEVGIRSIRFIGRDVQQN